MTPSQPEEPSRHDDSAADPSLESTSALIDRMRAGDLAARERLFSRVLPALRHWAHRRLPLEARDLHDTEDLVQIAALRAFSNLDGFESRGQGAFLAYLRQILMNAVRDEIRRVSRRPARDEADSEMPDPRPSALELTVGRETLERYERGLATLAANQQEAVIMRIELDLSYQEIAEALALVSAEAARKMVGRALIRVAEEIRERS